MLSLAGRVRPDWAATLVGTLAALAILCRRACRTHPQRMRGSNVQHTVRCTAYLLATRRTASSADRQSKAAGLVRNRKRVACSSRTLWWQCHGVDTVYVDERETCEELAMHEGIEREARGTRGRTYMYACANVARALSAYAQPTKLLPNNTHNNGQLQKNPKHGASHTKRTRSSGSINPERREGSTRKQDYEIKNKRTCSTNEHDWHSSCG